MSDINMSRFLTLYTDSAALSVSPEDVAASVQLALTEEGTLSEAYNWQETIISIPIEGITILKVLKVGAFLDVDVGFTMDEWSGTAHANFGARMSLSNDAIVKVDLLNSDNNAFSGWTPTFSALPLTLDAKIEGSAEVFAAPNVKLEASALGSCSILSLELVLMWYSQRMECGSGHEDAVHFCRLHRNGEHSRCM